MFHGGKNNNIYNKDRNGNEINPLSLNFTQHPSCIRIQDSVFTHKNFNFQKFGFSIWFKREVLNEPQIILNKGNGDASCSSFYMLLTPRNTIKFVMFADKQEISFEMTESFHSTRLWNHVFITYEAMQRDPRDRLASYVNGNRLTGFMTESSYSRFAPMQNHTGFKWEIGSMNASRYQFKGYIFQPAIFSNILPNIDEVYFSEKPMAVKKLKGLYSLLDCKGGDILKDNTLERDWEMFGNINIASFHP